jgi:hypothetical protein
MKISSSEKSKDKLKSILLNKKYNPHLKKLLINFLKK